MSDDKSGTRDDFASKFGGMVVVIIALAVLLAIVIVAIYALPAGQKAQNVVTVTTAAFGVIGTLVGAYFGIRAANKAVEQMSDKLPSARP
jgi:uncharacterized membrane protein YfcA